MENRSYANLDSSAKNKCDQGVLSGSIFKMLC